MKRTHTVRAIALCMVVLQMLLLLPAAMAETAHIPDGYKRMVIEEEVVYVSPDGVYYILDPEGNLIKRQAQPSQDLIAPKPKVSVGDGTGDATDLLQPEETTGLGQERGNEKLPEKGVVTQDAKQIEPLLASPKLTDAKGQDDLDDEKTQAGEKKDPSASMSDLSEGGIQTKETPQQNEDLINTLLQKQTMELTNGVTMQVGDPINVGSISFAPDPPTVGTLCVVTVAYNGPDGIEIPTGKIWVTLPGGVQEITPDTSNSGTIQWTPQTAGEQTIMAAYVPGTSDPYIAGTPGSATKTVAAISIVGKTVAFSATNYPYTGQEIKPEPKIDGLAFGTDFQVKEYVSNTNVGTATVTVEGIGNYTGEATGTFAIDRAEATLTLTATGGKGGAPITLSGTAKGVGDAPIANAAVTIDVSGDDTKQLPATTDASGAFTLSYTPPKNGTYKFIATLAETANHKTATSSEATVTVGAVDMAGTFEVTGGKAGVPVTLKVTITPEPGAAVPTGNVVFTWNGSPQVPVALANVNGVYQATMGVGILPGGKHTFGAVYNGDTNYTAKTFADTSIVVGRGTPSVVLSVAGGEWGKQAYIKVDVAGLTGANTPKGQVVIYRDWEPLATLTIDSLNQVEYIYKNPPAVRYTLHAVYLGDANYDKTDSNRVTINGTDDGRAAPTLALTVGMNKNSKNATLKASVTDPYWQYGKYPYPWDYAKQFYIQPTGKVVFYSGRTWLGEGLLDKDGNVSVQWNDVPYGTHGITAIYMGDNRYFNVATEKTLTHKKASTGSGSGSGSGSSASGGTKAPETGGIALRDVGGNVLASYPNPTVNSTEGTVTVHTDKTLDAYVLSVPMQQLKSYDSSTDDGYLNFVTPKFALHTPFALSGGMEGFASFLQSKSLSESGLELRLSVRQLDMATVGNNYADTNLDTGSVLAYFRIDKAIYDQKGNKLDYVPERLEDPLSLLVNQLDIDNAMVYDEATQSFVVVGVGMMDGMTTIEMPQPGVYALMAEQTGGALDNPAGDSNEESNG